MYELCQWRNIDYTTTRVIRPRNTHRDSDKAVDILCSLDNTFLTKLIQYENRFEDNKKVIRSRRLKNRHALIEDSKGRAPITPLKARMKFSFHRRVSSSCSTSGIRRVTIVKHSVISHKMSLWLRIIVQQNNIFFTVDYILQVSMAVSQFLQHIRLIVIVFK